MFGADAITVNDLVIVVLAFSLAGFVKGVVGMSLITVSLAVLIHFGAIHDAIALVVIPTFATNIWQSLQGKNRARTFRRFFPLYAAAAVGIFAGSHILVRTGTDILHPALGVVLIVYGTLTLSGYRPAIPAAAENRWAGASGAVSGLLGGITGSMIVPTVPFLSSLNLEREVFIQACGQFFLIGSVVLTLALVHQGLLERTDLAMSAGAVIPAAVGMAAGGAVRRYIPQAVFQNVLLVGLILVGCNLLFQFL